MSRYDHPMTPDEEDDVFGLEEQQDFREEGNWWREERLRARRKARGEHPDEDLGVSWKE